MKEFARLYARLDATTKTNEKVAALREYFTDAQPADGAWAVYFLTGRRLKRLVSTRDLRSWAAEQAGIPDWLFEESYHAVGDLAETVSLVLPPSAQADSRLRLHEFVDRYLLSLRDASPPQQQATIFEVWSQLDQVGRFVWNKLITGSFRVGVSRQLVVRALAQVANQEAAVIAHRLMGQWEPTAEFFDQLLAAEAQDAEPSRPYPFFLASPMEVPVAELGDVVDWLAEWKWDGIRAQVVRRSGQTFVWSRGEELVTQRFPELGPAAECLPDGTVLDGEILSMRGDTVLPFAELQRRIGRKRVGRKLLSEVPVKLLAFDLLEREGVDVRSVALRDRRAWLQQLLGTFSPDANIRLSPVVEGQDWAELAEQRDGSRSRHVEGLMLKRLDSPYGVGRQRGAWWKWKIDPLSVDAVMLYAQLGHGRRASLYTDYTFGLWKDDQLIPFAKAYSGLSDVEIREVDRFVRRSTIDRFGPVRHVKPELVFEVGFENIQPSKRHKSGIAVRFPRILRWRRDKTVQQADSLDSLYTLLPQGERP
jgi:DNA ligase-1